MNFSRSIVIVFDDFSLFYSSFAYFDTPEHLSDGLFREQGISVKRAKEYRHVEWPYNLVFAKCRKKDFSVVIAALDKLPEKMELSGHGDYMDFFLKFKRETQEKYEKMKSKNAV